MNKLILSVLFVGTCGLAFGQKTVGEATPVKANAFFNEAKTPTDTIVADGYANAAANGTLTLYGSANGGYVVGKNGYDDKAKVQRFLLNQPTQIEELIYAFGGKTESGNVPSTVACGLYSLDGMGESNGGTVTDAPNNRYASVDVNISDIDTAGLTIVPLPAITWVTEDVAAGFDITGLDAADTVGLVSSSDGDVGISDFAWEKWSDDTWHTFLQAWPLDFDLGVFLVIDESSAGINGEGTVNGMQLSFLNGNPVADNLVQFGYSIDHDANMNMEIMDINGRLVYTANLGNKAAGEYRHNVDVTELSSGSYYVSVVSHGDRLTKKMIIK